MDKISLEKEIEDYLKEIYEELENRGVYKDCIPKVIGKTGLMTVLETCPEEQMRHSIKFAVDEILLVAAMS